MHSKLLKQVLTVLNKAKRSRTGEWEEDMVRNEMEIDFDRHVFRNQNKKFMVEYALNPGDLKSRKKGTALITTKDLKDFINSLNCEVRFLRKGDVLVVITKKIRKHFSLDVKREIPARVATKITIEAGASKVPEKLVFSELKAILERVGPYTGRDDHRATLNYICLDKKNDCIVATDGCCLITTKLPFTPETNVLIGDISPFLKSIKGVKEILINSEKEATFFRMGDYLIVAEHCDGEYPPYKRVIPDARFMSPPIHLDIEDIKATLGIVNKATKQGILYFDEDGRMGYYCRTSAGIDYTVLRSTYRGERPVLGSSHFIAFNMQYFYGIMKAMGGDPEILLKDNKTAIIFNNEAGDQALVMPVKPSRAINDETLRSMLLGQTEENNSQEEESA